MARLSAPAGQVDVNVHPTKAEVQLREPARAFSLLQRALRAALAGQASSSTLRLRRPDRDLEWAPQAQGVIADAGIGPDADARQGRIERAAARPAEPAADPRRALPRGAAAAAPSTAPDVMPDAMPIVPPGAIDGAGFGPAPGSPWSAASGAAEPPPGSMPRSPRRGLAPLRMVGQLHRTFVIAEGEQGLVLVDQHAAHERVVYERLLAARAVAGRPAAADERIRQPLLDPPVVALDAAEAAVWSQAAEALAALGFELDEWGERALRLRAVPAGPGLSEARGELTAGGAERWLRDVLAELGGDARRANEQRFDRVAASVACHGSVRRGVVLDAPAMLALLRQLEACADPHSCPHGRPTLVEIAAADLLREFGRG